MRRLLPILLLFLLAAASVKAQRLYLGVGPTYSRAMSPLDTTNLDSWGGEVTFGSRKYCHFWFGARAMYTAWRMRTVNDSSGRVRPDTALTYSNQVTLSPEVRWFPVEPTTLPLYVQGMVSASRIGSTDSTSTLGVGVGGGIGYLLFYNSNCCGWFADVYAAYHAPNLLLRADARPSLEELVVGITINFSL